MLYQQSFTLNDRLLRACLEAGFSPREGGRSGQADFLGALVAANQGVVLLPRAIAREIERPGVVRVLLREPDLRWDIAILSGSVYGTAEEVARHAQKLLSAAGLEASHLPRASLDELKAFAPEAFLVVTSTTGMGELPDNLQPLYYAIRDQLPAWHGLPGGVIGLGDSSYGDTFCGGGEQVRELFGELGVREVLPMLRLDASETVTPETDAEPWLAEFAAALKG
ncbi:flavodoxin [Pseudomonas aeruginosa]|uniref:flavodoxin n=6 Tax=Gammaproteobacteria TaxID=1236 RepID=UPI002226D2DC|nr:flavodoxin [Pseudomonas aeruginosa]